MTSNHVRTVLLLFALVGLSHPVRATVIVPADLGELAREAQAIVRGRVALVDARWTDDHRAIESIVTLEVESTLKGSFGPEVQFRVPGGQLGRFRSLVVGAPEFAAGQRVVVFLGARGPSVPYVLGMSQGVYRMVAAGSGWLVSPPALWPSEAGTVPIVRGDPDRRALPIGDFEQRVRALLAGGAR
jgi:hypothetical protein